MAIFIIILAILLGIVVCVFDDKVHRIENRSDNSHFSSNPIYSGRQEVSHNLIGVKDHIPSTSGMQDDDSAIEKIEHYISWHDYQSKHPLRAKEIKSLGIDLSSKSDEDAAEWIFAIETTAHDSNCKISELRKKYLEGIEKHNPADADWLLMIPGLAKLSKKESQKYNLKIGNTAADMMLLFILDKIELIESKYINTPPLTKSDSITLQMRFMLESNDDVLMLQKAHIYLKNYPMTEQNKAYRDNWHTQMMSLIDNRVSPYESLKENPNAYKLAVRFEIYKLTHDEIPKEMQDGLVEEFNEHLLSFYEEMEIISAKASEKYMI